MVDIDKHHWTAQTLWLLEGTFLEIHPSPLGSWIIIDSRDDGTSLGESYSLPFLKKRALTLLKTKPTLKRGYVEEVNEAKEG